MLQMYFAFFNVESIREFTSTSVDICSATSYPFGFSSRGKRLYFDILKRLVYLLRNQYKKVTFIRVNEYGALARSSRFIKTCHNMNIIVQTTGSYASSLDGKIEIPNKTLANITRVCLMNSSHKKELGSPVELRIYCAVIFLTYCGMEQELHTIISKYGL